MKITGRYFANNEDSKEAVIEVSLLEGEISIGANKGDIIICVQKADLERVLKEITDDEEDVQEQSE